MKTIDAAHLRTAFLAAAERLDSQKERINELNVFPVPDGDTGTNMTMTIQYAVREVLSLSQPDMAATCRAISSGSLRGARGNSGVILSQLLRGFTREMQQQEEADVSVLAAASLRACETAYKAVIKPKEGTILTVARGVADKAAQMAGETDDILVFMKAVIDEGQAVLMRTPEMLPVLRQAGVVDSGGQGLMEVLRGAYAALSGETVPEEEGPAAGGGFASEAASAASFQEPQAAAGTLETDEIRFGYCTEFIVNLSRPLPDEETAAFRAYLEDLGDSIVLVADDELIKVHVHTNDPGLAIQKGLSFGSLSRIKIDNMREEHRERLFKASQYQDAAGAPAPAALHDDVQAAAPRKACGFVAVSAGEGLGEVFMSLGADVLVEGGQTMNPSTEDIAGAVRRVDADTVFILPNNKNIILAAGQVAEMVDDRQVLVVPSQTVPQGIAALINFIPEDGPKENLLRMQEEMRLVKTGQVTYAVRACTVSGRTVEEGDILGLGEDGLFASGTSVDETVCELLAAMIDGSSELVTLYYGIDIAAEDADALAGKLAERFPDVEIELEDGGQPVYYYIVSVE